MVALFLCLLGQKERIDVLDQMFDMDSAIHEREMANWRPAKTYLPPPRETINDQQTLIGTWRGLDVAELTFHRTSSGFQVQFSTSGCLSHWKAQRTATLSKGVVVLNRGVETYGGATFDRAYLVKWHGKPCLIPAGTMEHIAELNNPKRRQAFAGLKISKSEWIDFLSLRKRN